MLSKYTMNSFSSIQSAVSLVAASMAQPVADARRGV